MGKSFVMLGLNGSLPRRDQGSHPAQASLIASFRGKPESHFFPAEGKEIPASAGMTGARCWNDGRRAGPHEPKCLANAEWGQLLSMRRRPFRRRWTRESNCPRAQPIRSRVQSATTVPSTSSGMSPFSSTASWKDLRSKRSPSARLRLARAAGRSRYGRSCSCRPGRARRRSARSRWSSRDRSSPTFSMK